MEGRALSRPGRGPDPTERVPPALHPAPRNLIFRVYPNPPPASEAPGYIWGGVSWVASNAGEEGVGKYSREYTYDKVGNRLSMTLVDEDGVVSRDEDWTMEYNDLNQLDRRYDGASWSGADGDARWDYTYDDNGNLTQAKKEAKASGVWSETLKWVYEWNPRDQMTSKSFGPRLFNHSCQIPKTRTNRDKE